MRSWISAAAGLALIVGGMFIHSAKAAGPTTSITLTPTAATITADQTKTFVVTGKDAANDTTGDFTSDSTLSVNDPLGSFVDATYHAGKVGTWTIQATYQSFTATTTITVKAGALKELTINPNSAPEFVDQGTKKTFRVQGFDASSNPVTGFTASWSVIGTIGTIDSKGVFTASALGTGKVKVTSGTITAEIPVVVKSPDATNSNTNTTNSNANSNTNGSTNQNSNGNANGNTNQVTNDTVNDNTNAVNSNTNSSTGGTTNDLKCTTLAAWLWVVILIVFLVAVAVLYALVPVGKIWPAAIGLGGAIALVIVHRNYGCQELLWWDWVMALAALGLTVFAARQMPMPKSNNS